MAAIRHLDDKSHKAIIRSGLQIYKRTAITKKEFDDMGCERNCTHPSLSLSQWGETYRSIYLPNDTEVLDVDDRKAVLHAICLHYNFTDTPAPKNKKQQRIVLGRKSRPGSRSKPQNDGRRANAIHTLIAMNISWSRNKKKNTRTLLLN